MTLTLVGPTPAYLVQRCAAPGVVGMPPLTKDAFVRDALWRKSEELTRVVTTKQLAMLEEWRSVPSYLAPALAATRLFTARALGRVRQRSSCRSDFDNQHSLNSVCSSDK
jgi:hypothetical protein